VEQIGAGELALGLGNRVRLPGMLCAVPLLPITLVALALGARAPGALPQLPSMEMLVCAAGP
jgi:hypothetical protein